MDELFYRFRDYAVYEVIDTPKPRVNHDTPVTVTLAAYFVKEIAEKLKRTPKSTLSSLKRLKRNGKAIETFSGGWYSIDSAPSDVKLLLW